MDAWYLPSEEERILQNNIAIISSYLINPLENVLCDYTEIA